VPPYRYIEDLQPIHHLCPNQQRNQGQSMCKCPNTKVHPHFKWAGLSRHLTGEATVQPFSHPAEALLHKHQQFQPCSQPAEALCVMAKHQWRLWLTLTATALLSATASTRLQSCRQAVLLIQLMLRNGDFHAVKARCYCHIAGALI